MKYTAIIFVIFAGALKAEIPAGATDLVPRKDSSPAIERLQIKDEPVTTITYSEITITSPDSASSIEMPSVYLSKASKSEKKTEPNQSLQTTTMAVTDAAAQPPRQP